MDDSPLNGPKAKALQAYNSGQMNCSQSVITAYSDELGIDAETARGLVWGLGGGIGGMQRTCGALTAMTCVIGTQCARGGLDKKQTYEKVREACKRFEERLGSMDCIDILEGRKPSPLCCPHVVEAAIEGVEELGGTTPRS